MNLISLENAFKLPPSTDVHVVGVVTDSFPPKITRRGEYMLTITLVDQTGRMRARFFSRKESGLPTVPAKGDTILLSCIQTSRFHGEKLLQSAADDNGKLKWAMWRPSGSNERQTVFRPPQFGQAVSREHHVVVAKLRAWYSATGGKVENGTQSGHSPPNVTAAIPRRSGGREFALVRDLKVNSFYDMVGKVVKTFNVGNCVTIYVTDYTKNAGLYNYAPDALDMTMNKGWAGPWGQYTLQVSLWDAHAEAARYTVGEGKYVFLQNMRTKRNKDGRLEGALNGDRRFPDKVNVIVLEDMKDSRIRAIDQREREYKRRHENDEEKVELGEAREVDDLAAPQAEPQPKIQHKQGDENNLINCERPSMPFTSIREILEMQLPEQGYNNRKYHIIGKVVDFLPKKMEDFARSVEPEESDSEADETSKEEEWEWRFALLVQGRDGHHIQVIVSGKEAQYLLDLDADDLRSNQDLLAKLRKKLGILWGNTEEKYREAIGQPLRQLDSSNESPDAEPQLPKANNKRKRNGKNEGGNPDKRIKPEGADAISADIDHETAEEDDSENLGEAKFFEACLMEYGVGERKRMFKIFGTTIMV